VENFEINIKKEEQDSDFDDKSLCLEDLEDFETMSKSWTKMNCSRTKLTAEHSFLQSNYSITNETLPLPCWNNETISLENSRRKILIGHDYKFLQIVNETPISLCSRITDDVKDRKSLTIIRKRCIENILKSNFLFIELCTGGNMTSNICNKHALISKKKKINSIPVDTMKDYFAEDYLYEFDSLRKDVRKS